MWGILRHFYSPLPPHTGQKRALLADLWIPLARLSGSPQAGKEGGRQTAVETPASPAAVVAGGHNEPGPPVFFASTPLSSPAAAATAKGGRGSRRSREEKPKPVMSSARRYHYLWKPPPPPAAAASRRPSGERQAGRQAAQPPRAQRSLRRLSLPANVRDATKGGGVKGAAEGAGPLLRGLRSAGALAATAGRGRQHGGVSGGGGGGGSGSTTTAGAAEWLSGPRRPRRFPPSPGC